MRVFLQVTTAVALAWIVTPAAAQDSDPNAAACASKSGDEAIAGCTAAIESGKLNAADTEGAIFLRGHYYLDEKDYARAIADFSSAVRLNPRDTTAFILRGNAHVMQKDYARGIADYGEAIRLDPHASVGFNNRGWAYYLAKNYARAIADYNAAIRRDPRNAQVLYGRGLVEAKLGQKAASNADMSRAITIQPDIAKAFPTAAGQGR